MPNQNTNHRQLYKDATDFLTHGGESDVLTSWIVNHHMTSGQLGAPCGKEPAISVIVPCHNYGLYLKECILSIIMQSFTAWELIIVNDGSTDTTHEVALGLLAEFPSHYISYVNQPQSGIVQPRNRGVCMARGEYILPLDADDMIAPRFLEKTHALLSSRPDLGFVSTKALFFGDINKIWPRAVFNPRQLFIKNQQGNTTLYRKEMWQDVGGYTESMIHGYMDWEFWIKCVKHGWTGEQIDEPLYFYRRKNDSIVMKAKKNDAHIKTQIMKLHPEVYDVSRIRPNDDRLSKKNFIHPDFLRQDFTVTPKSASKTACDHIASGKKKILFICHNFPPRRYAGAQLYALHLAQEINRLNLAHVEVLYPVFDKRDTTIHISKDHFDGVTIHELHKPKTGLTQDNYRNETLRDALAAFYAQGTYDAVHIHSLGGQLSGIPIDVAVSLDIPVVMTLHDHWFLCHFWFLTTPDQQICTGPESVQKCVRCILAHSTSHHVKKQNHELITQFVQQRNAYLYKIFHKTNLRIAPSRFLATTYARYGFDGIDIQPLGMVPQTHLPKSTSLAVRFGYIGRISHRKGVNILLEAYQCVVTDSATPATLHIFGTFDDSALEKSTRQKVASMPSVRYEGPYTPEDLPRIFASIDVLVVPSLWENYPLVVQEAFMHKTPVIASDVGGFPEAITHNRNGLLFRVGSVDDLTAAMLGIINNPTLLAELAANIPPVRSIADDAALYVHHYERLLTAEPTPTPSPDSKAAPRSGLPTVQFYVYKNVHWPMFESLFEYLRGRPDVGEIVICLPNIPQLTNADGAYQLVRKLMNLGARIVTDPRQAGADITFIADTIAGKVHGCGRIVNLGHGTISKGYYFTQSVWTERENWVDLLCVPGEYARERMAAILRTRVVATGMPKLDPVFAGQHSRHALCDRLGLDARKKIILYAPTFNLNLSSAFAFADRFHQLDAPDRYVLIKLHGSTVADLANRYRLIAARSKQILFIEEPNIAPCIGGADIMISDVSSAFMEFMALDKPVILYDNPNRETYHGYDPANIEYAWRDLGTQVGSFDEMLTALGRLLQNDDSKNAIRRRYAEQLFADRTGQASANVWHEAKQLLQAPAAPPLPVFSILIHLEPGAHILARKLIHNLQFYSVMPLELVLVQTSGQLPESFLDPLTQFNEFVRVTVVDAPREASLGQALSLGLKACRGDFICVLRDDVSIFKNFDYILYQTFAAHAQTDLLTGLANLQTPALNAFDRLPNDRNESGEALAYRFINHFGGTGIEALPSSSPLPPLVVVRASALGRDADDLQAELTRIIAQGVGNICLSLFYLCLDDGLRRGILQMWHARASIPPAQRIKLAHEIQQQFCCPDLAEEMVRILLEQGDASPRLDLGIGSSLHTRYYDLDYKKWLLGHLPASNSWLQPLRQDHEVITALLAAMAARPAPAADMQLTPQPSAKFAPSAPRILLYFFKNVHIPILMPIHAALKALRPEASIAFGHMRHAPEIRAGFTPDELKTLADMGEPMFAQPQDFHPDLTFIADSVYPWVKDCGKLVHVGHGVLSKGQYYTDTDTARREEAADLICVPGKHHQRIMRSIVSKPVVATGMAKLDALFAGRITRASVLKRYGLPDSYRYVLFAPTFNDELSAIPLVGDRIGEVLPDNRTLVIVKLHPSTKAEYKRMYQALPARDQRIIYADELDITPFLALCDVMISDVSSAMMEFAALDKPVILFNSPHWRDYPNYNPADIEFNWRDIGIQVSNLDEIRKAVALCLQHPDMHEKKRQEYSDQLFANKKNGDAAERIVKLALALIEKGRN